MTRAALILPSSFGMPLSSMAAKPIGAFHAKNPRAIAEIVGPIPGIFSRTPISFTATAKIGRTMSSNRPNARINGGNALTISVTNSAMLASASLRTFWPCAPWRNFARPRVAFSMASRNELLPADAAVNTAFKTPAKFLRICHSFPVAALLRSIEARSLPMSEVLAATACSHRARSAIALTNSGALAVARLAKIDSSPFSADVSDGMTLVAVANITS